MRQFPDKFTKGTGPDFKLPADEWNDLKNNVNRILTSAGIAFSTDDPKGITQSIAKYAHGGSNFYTDSGTANNYVLTITGAFETVPVYFVGMEIRFIPQNSCTGTTVTINVASLGTVTVLNSSGSTPSANSILAGRLTTLYYNGVNMILQDVSSNFPVGSRIGYLGSTPPSGWLECDGSLLNRTTYASLFAVIGTQYDSSVSGSQFRLPDFRGYFSRSWNHGASNDPDAASRTDRGDGTGGDVVGSKQADQLKAHTHTINAKSLPVAGTGVEAPLTEATSATDNTYATVSTGGNETRPKNFYEMYIIKF